MRKLIKSIFTKKFYLKRYLYNNDIWTPINYKDDPSCPGVEVGDYVAVEILNETIDYIYQIVYKKDGSMKPNRRVLWKVIKRYDDDLLLESKGSRILLKYSEWIDSNVLRTPKAFLRDEADYAFFIENKST